MITKFIQSWKNDNSPLNSTEDILSWVSRSNKELHVDMKPIGLSSSDFWFYDEQEGAILNKNRSFFSICGLQKKNGDEIIWEQPVICQNEIGYIGIICKEFDGILHFLMQAKIEPGNINKIQISPTIQATKSNFTQKHGGRKPAYLDYFINAAPEQIVVDQIQSEQSSRFYKKRNRNIMIYIQSDIEVLPSHRWMTLGQIKHLMHIDNLVNMDTRTVLSCIPFSLWLSQSENHDGIVKLFNDKTLYRSMLPPEKSLIPEIYHYINQYKMFDETSTELVALKKLQSWKMSDNEIICKKACDFKVIFCDISIEGREVKRWTQPLFAASDIATFGLITTIENGIRKFVVSAHTEIGCFDKLELAPSVQLEASKPQSEYDAVENLFMQKISAPDADIKIDVLLSEEGGRFWQEQNRNVIVQMDIDCLQNLPAGYFLVDFYTLNLLCQVNNTLNIQLRNLLSLLNL